MIGVLIWIQNFHWMAESEEERRRSQCCVLTSLSNSGALLAALKTRLPADSLAEFSRRVHLPGSLAANERYYKYYK